MGPDMAISGTLCYIRSNGRVLLQLKAADRFGGGFWNSPGGKLVDGESPEAATVREVQEETGLTVRDLRDHGTLIFYFGEDEQPKFAVQVFSTERFKGDLTANDEGRLAWFDEDRLPYDQMWPDDRLWVPHMLAGHRFRGVFRLSDDHTQLISHDLQVEP